MIYTAKQIDQMQSSQLENKILQNEEVLNMIQDSLRKKIDMIKKTSLGKRIILELGPTTPDILSRVIKTKQEELLKAKKEKDFIDIIDSFFLEERNKLEKNIKKTKTKQTKDISYEKKVGEMIKTMIHKKEIANMSPLDSEKVENGVLLLIEKKGVSGKLNIENFIKKTTQDLADEGEIKFLQEEIQTKFEEDPDVAIKKKENEKKMAVMKVIGNKSAKPADRRHALNQITELNLDPLELQAIYQDLFNSEMEFFIKNLKEELGISGLIGWGGKVKAKKLNKLKKQLSAQEFAGIEQSVERYNEVRDLYKQRTKKTIPLLSRVLKATGVATIVSGIFGGAKINDTQTEDYTPPKPQSKQISNYDYKGEAEKRDAKLAKTFVLPDEQDKANKTPFGDGDDIPDDLLASATNKKTASLKKKMEKSQPKISDETTSEPKIEDPLNTDDWDTDLSKIKTETAKVKTGFDVEDIKNTDSLLPNKSLKADEQEVAKTAKEVKDALDKKSTAGIDELKIGNNNNIDEMDKNDANNQTGALVDSFEKGELPKSNKTVGSETSKKTITKDSDKKIDKTKNVDLEYTLTNKEIPDQIQLFKNLLKSEPSIFYDHLEKGTYAKYFQDETSGPKFALAFYEAFGNMPEAVAFLEKAGVNTTKLAYAKETGEANATAEKTQKTLKDLEAGKYKKEVTPEAPDTNRVTGDEDSGATTITDSVLHDLKKEKNEANGKVTENEIHQAVNFFLNELKEFYEKNKVARVSPEWQDSELQKIAEKYRIYIDGNPKKFAKIMKKIAERLGLTKKELNTIIKTLFGKKNYKEFASNLFERVK